MNLQRILEELTPPSWKEEARRRRARERRDRWDKEHIVTVSTRLTLEEYVLLKLYCDVHEITRYQLLKDGIFLYLVTHGITPETESVKTLVEQAVTKLYEHV